MSGTTPRRRHGLAGLLAILFVVGGLIFSYGLGHAPVPRMCTEHAVSAPLSAASPSGGHQTPETAVSPHQGLHGFTGTALKAGAALKAGTAPAASTALKAGTAPAASAALEAGAALKAGTALEQAPPQGPAYACLCLAVLFTLVLLGLAAGPGRPAFRLPARAGWALAPPSAAAHAPVLRPFHQVLRL
ncbi:hypothetical protein [Actinomadura sp. 7K507]|uniref:hypothetical protein n=1 Tax=Actinomadura sp. 7K507 TaxID=2530365 RepID=UPI0010476901|nr:hypothetical protein [Actinomadura sp. 7K507]TDC96490.1 hypothetical protein E1285_05755 [Actinomadura sp. 7K507]